MSSTRISKSGPSPTARGVDAQDTSTKTQQVGKTAAAKTPVAAESAAPLSNATSQRLAGKLGAAERTQLLDVGATALGRVTDAVRTFHGLDHLKPYTGKDFPIGERPAQLPKVLARVTQDLAAIKEAAAHAEPGAPGFSALLEDFLVVHAALERSSSTYKYESEGAYPEAMKRLKAKTAEIWALAPAFLGADAAARLTAQWLPTEPADLPPVRDAAGKLSEMLGGYYSPDYNAAPGSALKKAANVLRDNVGSVNFVREGGKFSVAIDGVGITRFVSGRGELPKASVEAVEAAARTLLKHIGSDDTVPITVNAPRASPTRTEEAWSILTEAIAQRGFIDTPKSGDGGYSMRRWDPTLEVETPRAHGHSGYRMMKILMHSNYPVSNRERTFKEGTPSRLESDASNYLWRAGFRDVPVLVEWAPRRLTEASAQALAGQLDALRGGEAPSWKSAPGTEVLIKAPAPSDMTPREVLQTYATAVEVQPGTYGSGREVVVFAEPIPGMRAPDQLRFMEEAVRALVDDPALQGTPIRVRVDAGSEPYEQHSILFGRTMTEGERAKDADYFDNPSPYLDKELSWRGKDRGKDVAEFATLGAAESNMVTDMVRDPDGAAWRGPLQANLSAYYLGSGTADPGWARAFEALTPPRRTEFLALALRFLDDVSRPPPRVTPPDLERLGAALELSRRLPARVGLEAGYAKNGTQVEQHQAHTDAALRSALGGPALAQAQQDVAAARAAG